MADNHKIKNIYHMLSYAYQTLREDGYKDVAAEEFEHIHDLYAAIIVHEVGIQIKRGLHRDYVAREEALSGLRGQIRIAESIKQQTMPQGKLVCAYDEFAKDTLHNQTLKSTMFMLLRHGGVKPENKRALKKLLLYFHGVSDIEPAAIRWDGLKYHRNNASYRMLIGICHLAVRGFLLTTEWGSNKLASWSVDEEMHRLYERFVLSYFQYHHPDYDPKAAHVEWDLWDAFDRSYLPTMKTDITLTNEDRRLIIDTKYCRHMMQVDQRYGREKIYSPHLYQILAYVKNCDKERKGNVAGVLLYAKTDEETTPDNDFNMGGNKISVKTLDLNRDWREITEQLEGLCEWLQ